MSDPRHFQIITLTTLVGLQMMWADFGPDVYVFGVTLVASFLTQAVCIAILRFRKFPVPVDFRSSLITALSLTILLKASALWIHPLAAVFAIGSKFVFRFDDKHIFNPANFGIVVVLILFPSASWISPGQWGAEIWLGLLLAGFALLVLYKIPRRDIAPVFLGFWGCVVFGRAIWLGDPFSIPLHQIQNGALLIFAFFMISDPKTIPDHWMGRTVFALAVSVVGSILTFTFQVREGLFYALALVCLFRPLIDYVWKDEIYTWEGLTLLKEIKRSRI